MERWVCRLGVPSSVVHPLEHQDVGLDLLGETAARRRDKSDKYHEAFLLNGRN